MAPAISIMRSLPGGFLRTTAVKRPAKTTATAPPPIARRTLASICFSFLTVASTPGPASLRTRGWPHGGFGECSVEAVDFHARDDVDSPVAAPLGVVAGAVEALLADRKVIRPSALDATAHIEARLVQSVLTFRLRGRDGVEDLERVDLA